MNKLFNTFSAKVKDLGDGVIEAVIASDTKDRHGEILKIEGVDLSDYKKNPVVLWAHNYNEPPIAKAISIRKAGGKLISKMQFAINEYPFAHQIYKLYAGGYLNAFSIGFIPDLDYYDNNTYEKSSMLEYSAVPIPANPEALAVARSKGFDVDSLLQGAEHSLDETQGGGEKLMKLTKEQIKAILLGDPEYKFDETEADEELVAEVKTEIEAERKAEEEPEEESQETKAESVDLDAVGKLLDSKLKELEEKLDAPKKKNISTVRSVVVTPNAAKMPKEDKFKTWLKGMMIKDLTEYKDIVAKSGMTTSNVSEVLPPTEFIAEVLRLEEEFGVARRNVTMRRTDRRSITGIKGGDDVAIFETAEAGVKQSTKATYDSWVLTFRKFAAIAPLTDELLEDSAIDIWNDLTQRFARAYAEQEDKLVFTDATSGIVNATNAAEVEINGDSIEDITFDEVNRALYAVPTPSMRNGKFYFNRTILGVLQRIKDTQGRYILIPGPNGPVTGTLWGMPYELVEVLPSLAQDAADTAFIVFGDLRNTVMGERTSLSAKIFDTGLVGDPDEDEQTGNEINLMTQDMQALRVVKRFNSVNLFEEAYALIKTAAAAS